MMTNKTRKNFTGASLLMLAFGLGCGASPSPSTSTEATQGSLATSLDHQSNDALVSEEVLASDSETSTGQGRFVAPSGWTRRVYHSGRVELLSPERDLWLNYFEFEQSAGESAALIQESWQKVHSDFAREIENTREVPASEGWDAISVNSYRTTPEESMVVQSLLQTKGSRRYLVLIEGTMAGLSRRGAQVGNALATYRTEGVRQESWAEAHVQNLEGAKLEEFRAFVRQAMNDLHVPGLVVGVVNGDSTYTEGFGVRELNRPEPVNSETLFMIGSTSKSFLTLLQARMVDQGRLRWDEPLHEILPNFDLANHDVAQQVQLRHSVCACTGMPRRDIEMFFDLNARRAETFVEEIRSFTPTTGFGEVFQYSNHLVAVGGYATAHRLFPRLGLFEAWDRAVQEEILRPLGMRSTFTRIRDAVRRNHASPHSYLIDNSSAVIPMADERAPELAGPCGGLWSNADDMLKYVRMSLAEGALPAVRGRAVPRLVSEENYRMREQRGIRIADESFYGLGLVIDGSHGVERIGHGGNTLGFTSTNGWIRSKNFGWVILSNARIANALHSLIEAKLFQLMMDLHPQSTPEQRLASIVETNRSEQARALSEIEQEPEVAALRPWFGNYRTEAGLDFTLGERDGKVYLDEGQWHSFVGLRRVPGSSQPTFILLDGSMVGMEFQQSEEGGQRTLTLDAGQQVYRFVRQSN